VLVGGDAAVGEDQPVGAPGGAELAGHFGDCLKHEEISVKG
jgi:hypothetical protein